MALEMNRVEPTPIASLLKMGRKGVLSLKAH